MMCDHGRLLPGAGCRRLLPAAPLAHFARTRLPASATHTAPRWRRWAGGGGPQQPVNAGMGVGRPTPHRCAWRCARLCARAVCAVCSCGLSSACACSGPCLLRVPVLCVLGLCAQPRRDVTCAGDATELCVEKGITLGIHVHTSTMNASGHSTGRACTRACSLHTFSSSTRNACSDGVTTTPRWSGQPTSSHRMRILRPTRKAHAPQERMCTELSRPPSPQLTTPICEAKILMQVMSHRGHLRVDRLQAAHRRAANARAGRASSARRR
jgi:hypothetical protein